MADQNTPGSKLSNAYAGTESSAANTAQSTVYNYFRNLFGATAPDSDAELARRKQLDLQNSYSVPPAQKALADYARSQQSVKAPLRAKKQDDGQ
jgi:hypothetical protein